MLKALPSLFPNLVGAHSGARVEFYDKFQREADEHDHDFTKKCDEDLNTTLIFVSVFQHPPHYGIKLCSWGDRLVYSPRSRPLSLLTFKITSDQTLIPPLSTSSPYFMQAWQHPSSPHSSLYWANNGSVVMSGQTCVDLLLIAAGIGSAR